MFYDMIVWKFVSEEGREVRNIITSNTAVERIYGLNSIKGNLMIGYVLWNNFIFQILDFSYAINTGFTMQLRK